MPSATMAPGETQQSASPPPAGGRPPTRVSPHLVLAVLTVLSLGALAWSLAAAPPVARTLLRQAAGNTAAVSSVQVVESISQVTGGHAALLQSIELLLERPDRVEQVQQSDQTLVIGQKVYVSPNGGRTWYPDPNAGRVDVSLVFQRVLQPMQLLRSATTVRASQGQTRFALDVNLSDLTSAMHLGLPVSGPARTVPVTVTVQNEFVTGFSAHITEGADHLLVQVRYSHLDDLPTLVAPVVAGG